MKRCRIREIGAIVAVGMVVVIGGCGGDSTQETSAAAKIPEQSGKEARKRSRPKVVVPDEPPPKRLVIKDLIEGTGPKAEKGDEVVILYRIRRWDGSEFSNSWKYSEPPHAILGYGHPQGFYDSIKGMRVGGRREGLMPSTLYSTDKAFEPPPPSESLVFVVDLLDVEKDVG